MPEIEYLAQNKEGKNMLELEENKHELANLKKKIDNISDSL